MADGEALGGRVPSKFHPPSMYKFPTRKFGSKGEKRSFRAEWCKKYDWLHYDKIADAAFCHLCLTAEKERKFLASTKRDPAFISKGYVTVILVRREFWSSGPKSPGISVRQTDIAEKLR